MGDSDKGFLTVEPDPFSELLQPYGTPGGMFHGVEAVVWGTPRLDVSEVTGELGIRFSAASGILQCQEHCGVPPPHPLPGIVNQL